jgi:hypothetical protein
VLKSAVCSASFTAFAVFRFASRRNLSSGQVANKRLANSRAPRAFRAKMKSFLERFANKLLIRALMLGFLLNLSIKKLASPLIDGKLERPLI